MNIYMTNDMWDSLRKRGNGQHERTVGGSGGEVLEGTRPIQDSPKTASVSGHAEAGEAHKENDPVLCPAHYDKGGIECLDAIDAAIEGLEGREAHYTACAIKYLWRWPHKGQKVQDLLKARRYIDRLVCYIEGQDPAS